MLGQLCPLGTGAFDLLLNEDELAHAVDLLADEEDYEYGDGFMTPGRMTPGHMTPSRTPHYTPNRSALAGSLCIQHALLLSSVSSHPRGTVACHGLPAHVLFTMRV
jgi:DNA-directed RNA polymerase II subunit RPB1